VHEILTQYSNESTIELFEEFEGFYTRSGFRECESEEKKQPSRRQCKK
jgi:hypothetical protein